METGTRGDGQPATQRHSFTNTTTIEVSENIHLAVSEAASFSLSHWLEVGKVFSWVDLL